MSCGRRGSSNAAIAAYRQAIALRPNYPEAHYNLGNGLFDTGHFDEALAACRQAIALRPGYAEAYSNLGNAFRYKGQLDDAIAACCQAIALKPDLAEAYSNLGSALHDKGQLDEAIAACRQAIALKPDLAEAYSGLGSALHDKGQLDEAIAAYRQAIVLKPSFAEARSNLGVALGEKGRFDEAITAFRQAITLKPNFPDAHCNLGNALRDSGRLDDAIVACRQAIALKPDFTGAYSNLGNALSGKGQLDEAIAVYRQALALDPNFPEAHYNLATRLLYRGDLAAGWAEYEWRWKCRDVRPIHRSFSQPQWDGSPLTGRTIFIHAEQGFGDTLQFVRYLSLVASGGGRIFLECQRELHRLFESSALPGPHQLLTRGQPLPAFDLHYALLSLPLAFQTTLDTIPHDVPYLRANPALVQRWRAKLGAAPAPLKVGLVWAGRKSHGNDRNRSMPLAALAPLARVPNISFYNLQKDDPARQAAHPPPGMRLIDYTSELADFADTAALIANLDLVISVDTSIVHLAGALAKPVWVLLCFAPDWRWLQDRLDSPWYPTLRLFRQPQPGDWPSALNKAADALAQLGRSYRSRP